MAEYIEREAFLEQKREQYCKDCASRKGMRNGKYKTLYEIGEAPCRACRINDVLNDVEDFPAADVAPVRHGHYIINDMGDARCSECRTPYLDITGNFCPECGARLDLREAEH